MNRRSAPLLGLLVLAGCGSEERCPSVPVQTGRSQWVAPWMPEGFAVIRVTMGDRPVSLVIDTAYPQTAVKPQTAGGLDLTRVLLHVGGSARAGPVSVGLFDSALPVDGVLGADVAHLFPMVFNARERTTTFDSAFVPSSDGAELSLGDSGLCEPTLGSTRRRQAPLFIVPAELEGAPVSLVLDTGAEVTLVASDLHTKLGGARLRDIRISTAFAGAFLATAARARSLKVAGEEVNNAALLSSPEADAELTRLTELTGQTIQGLLGWNFLREFRVDLAGGEGPTGGRRLALTRFDTQTHWARELVGVGIYTSAQAQPRGLRIDGFTSPSPARDAGIAVGEVITHLNGTSVLEAPLPFAAPGATVRLTLWSNGPTRELDVQVADLLPDP